MIKQVFQGLILATIFIAFPTIINSTLHTPQWIYNYFYGIPFDISMMIVLFSLISLVKAVVFKKRFEEREIYTLTGLFLLFVVSFNFIYKLYSLIRLTSALGISFGYYGVNVVLTFSVSIIVMTFSVFGIELVIASYFLNVFQNLLRIKPRFRIPFMQQIRVSTGLIIALTLIGLFSEGIYRLLSDYYIWGVLNVYLVAILLPLLIALNLIRKSQKGTLLERKSHEEFFKDVKEVADKVGVSEPHEIILSPGSDIGVTGLTKKRLILGVATLDKMTKDELKSILAHEFGHIFGGDTVVGGIINGLRTALQSLGTGSGGVGGLLFKFMNLVFSAITLFYSRQVEYRADIIAAQVYGPKLFSQALIDYSTYAEFFERAYAPSILKHASEKNEVIKNVYKLVEQDFTKEKKKEMETNMLSQKTSLLSTHPSISDRIKKIQNVECDEISAEKEHVGKYFHDITILQENSTKILVLFVAHLITLSKRHQPNSKN